MNWYYHAAANQGKGQGCNYSSINPHPYKERRERSPLSEGDPSRTCIYVYINAQYCTVRVLYMYAYWYVHVHILCALRNLVHLVYNFSM